jgi:hypothetical protein
MRLTLGTNGVKPSWRKKHSDACWTAGGRGMPQPKIPVSAIHDVLRAMDEAPDCDETEVVKVEAMRRLVPAIKTMQAKGYGLAHVAQLLSDKGIVVTEAALKQYVHRLGSRKVTETPRSTKRDRAATVPAARLPGHSPRPVTTAAPEQAARQPPHVDPAGTAPPRSVTSTATVSPAPPPPGPSAPATQVPLSRSGFVVRPDRKNL